MSTAEGEANTTNTVYTCGMVTELKSGANTVNYEYDHKRRKTKVGLNGAEYITYDYAGSPNDNNSFVITSDVTIGVTAFESMLTDKVTATLKGTTNVVTETFTDKRGNLRKVTVGGAVQIANNYNSNGTVNESGDGVTNSVTSYTYDPVMTDRVTSAEKTQGMDSYNYIPAVSEAYGYNNDGQMTSRTVSGAVSHSYGYAYKSNAAKDLDYMTMPGGIKSAVTADVLGRPELRTLSYNNQNVLGQYTYYRKHGDHATNTVSSIRYGGVKNGKYVIGDGLKYSYDKSGNISEVWENGRLSVKYAYDALNRLVREDNKALGKTYLWTYDNNGNILTKNETYYSDGAAANLYPLKRSVYSYDGVHGDRLANIDTEITHTGEYCGEVSCGGGSACPGGKETRSESFVYDAIGNPTTYRGKTLTWQKGRNLAVWDAAGINLAFTYDGYGRRIKKGNTVYTYATDGKLIKQSDGVTALEFIYDTSELIL